MAKKKKNGGGMSTGRKWIRRGIAWGGKIIGGFVIFSPVIAEKDKLIGGDLDGFANGVAYRYTGYTPSTGAFDPGQTLKGVGTVAAGILVAYLFGKAAQRM